VKGERTGPYIYYCLYDTKLLELLTELTDWRETVMQQIQESEEDKETSLQTGM